jgi:SSS family solute:Na+ symporter
LEATQKFYTFPQIFGHYYGRKTALLAALISTLGYIGFTSSQLLAGAKLASATFITLDLTTALMVMGGFAILYTAIGGIKAVIYTDTAQWMILMGGLIFIGIPVSHYAIGGFDAIAEHLPASHLDITNISWQTWVNWAITITPIWFVGMTLYQRIYACKDVKTAKRAWYTAGLLEYPVMAFMGIVLGIYARVALAQGMFAELGFGPGSALDSELGMPLLLRTVLPAGLMGLVMAAYFSAILSTADSCLMAASGSVVGDFIRPQDEKKSLRLSQIATLVLGVVALLLAMSFENVLSLMLYSYSFMVSGLLVPLLGALFFHRRDPIAAMVAMMAGGITTVVFSIKPLFPIPFGLDANVMGILVSAILFFAISSKSTSIQSV